MAQITSIRAAKAVVYSRHFETLAELFSHLHPPYTAEDARSFSKLYSKVYRDLSPLERGYAEGMVDRMIEGLERPEHASLIYGVV